MNTSTVLVRPLDKTDRHQAAVLIGAAFEDNETQQRLISNDPRQVAGALTTICEAMMGWNHLLTLAVYQDGEIGGVLCAMPPGLSPSIMSQLRALPAMLRLGMRTLSHLAGYNNDLLRAIPKVPRWYVGPVAVRPDLQGKGLGTKLMREFCRRADDGQAPAYLLTDEDNNTRFYEHFGFSVTDTIEAVSLPHWVMRRDSGSAPT